MGSSRQCVEGLKDCGAMMLRCGILLKVQPCALISGQRNAHRSHETFFLRMLHEHADTYQRPRTMMQMQERSGNFQNGLQRMQ
jgi:hypothetical protein